MSYDLRPRAGERPAGAALPRPLEYSQLPEEELTASQAVVLLQTAAEVQDHIPKDAVSLENVELQSDIIAESFSEGEGQPRPPHVEGFNRPVLSHSEGVHTLHVSSLPPKPTADLSDLSIIPVRAKHVTHIHG